MPRFVAFFFWTIATISIANAALILLNLIARILTGSPAITTTIVSKQKSAAIDCAAVCRNRANFSQIRRVDYAEITATNPHLDLSYRETLVRLGTDTAFDLSQCPPDSLMLKREKNFHPKHLDCPTLFLVGARKGGTSSLYHYVSKHPDFEGTRLDAGPKVGETFYFSSFYESRTWEQYLSLFPSDGVMTGDASVGNLVHPLAPKRLYESCGKQARVVMLFRDPINRVESNFLMRSKLRTNRIGAETAISPAVRLQLDNFFSKALERTLNMQDLPRDWNKLVGLFLPATSMIYEGLYYVHLMNWLCNFPAENILVIKSEEFYKRPGKILDIVYQYLGLERLDEDTYNWITAEYYNKGNYSVPSYQKLSLQDKTNMMGLYRPFNRALLRLLKWNATDWHR